MSRESRREIRRIETKIERGVEKLHKERKTGAEKDGDTQKREQRHKNRERGLRKESVRREREGDRK